MVNYGLEIPLSVSRKDKAVGNFAVCVGDPECLIAHELVNNELPPLFFFFLASLSFYFV